MREESHLEEMRSAIRGDFERLRERRGDQELMRVGAAPPDEPEEPPERPLANVDEPEPEPEPERSWLARFFSS